MSRSPPSERAETLVRRDRRAEGCRRPSDRELASLLLTIIPACLKVLQGPLEAERGRHLSNLSPAPRPSSPHRPRIMLDASPITSQLTCFGIHLGQSERIAVLILGWDFFFPLAFLMHYAIELQSGCEGPFHPAKCLIGVSSVSAAALSFFIPLCSSPLKSLPPFEAEWSDTNEFVRWGQPSPPCSSPLRALQPNVNETNVEAQTNNSLAFFNEV